VTIRRAARTVVGLLALCLLPATGVMAQDDLPATLGASTPEFQDDIGEPDQWGLPDARGTTTDTTGAIEMTFDDAGWMWGWRTLEAAHHPVVRIEGWIATEGGGDVAGGWMCGASDTLFAYGVVDGDGRWRIGHIIEGKVTVDDEGTLDEPPIGVPNVGVECGQENVDVTRVLLRVDGESVGTADVGPLGPFDRVAIVGASDAGEGTLVFDDIAVWTGDRYAPSDEAPSTPGPAPTTRVVTGILGADILAFHDDFAVLDQWGTGASAEGIVSYTDEQLAITVLVDGSSRWSWRSLDGGTPVLRVEGLVAMNGDGAAGWMCGDATDTPSFLYGVTGSSGTWAMGQVVDGIFTTLDSGDLSAGAPAAGVAHHVVLECGDTDDDATRVVLWVDGEQVGDVTADDARGPFTKVTAMAASASDTVFNATFDDVSAWTGDEPAPTRD
jgi:hypothetical protein